MASSFLVVLSAWTWTSERSAARWGSTRTSAAPAPRTARAASEAPSNVRREMGGRVMGMGRLLRECYLARGGGYNFVRAFRPIGDCRLAIGDWRSPIELGIIWTD